MTKHLRYEVWFVRQNKEPIRFTVGYQEVMLVGDYLPGREFPLTPARDGIEAQLPHQYRAAFRRAPGWHTEFPKPGEPSWHYEIHSVRYRLLGEIFARPLFDYLSPFGESGR